MDERGRPLMRAIIWMDSRGAEQVRRITRGFPAVQGYGLAKLAAWVRRSGGAPGHADLLDLLVRRMVGSLRVQRPPLERRLQ